MEVYWAISLVLVCTLALFVTTCVIIAWVVLYYRNKRDKRILREKKAASSSGSSHAMSVATVGVDKIGHAPHIHEKTFSSLQPSSQTDSKIHGGRAAVQTDFSTA